MIWRLATALRLLSDYPNDYRYSARWLTRVSDLAEASTAHPIVSCQAPVPDIAELTLVDCASSCSSPAAPPAAGQIAEGGKGAGKRRSCLSACPTLSAIEELIEVQYCTTRSTTRHLLGLLRQLLRRRQLRRLLPDALPFIRLHSCVQGPRTMNPIMNPCASRHETYGRRDHP